MGLWDKVFSRKKPDPPARAHVEPEWAKAENLIVIKSDSGGSVYDDGIQRAGGAPRGNRGLSLYASSAWLYAGARLIAQSLAQVPLLVFLDGEPAPDDDPLVQLLKRPAPKWSYNRFAQASALYQILTGSVFWQKLRPSKGGQPSLYVPGVNAPRMLWPFGEDSYSASVEDEGIPFLKHYEDFNGDDVDPTEVIHSLFIRPGYGFEDEGLGPAEAGQDETETDLAASEWQRRTLANRAVPDGVFKLKKLATSTAQYDEITKKIEDKWAGSLNAGRPLVLGQEVDWMALARSAVELDLQNGRIQTRQSILAPIGVPPILVGDLSRASYNNYSTALLSFWTLTVLPLHANWLDAWNTELAPEFGTGYEIRADHSHVDGLMPLVKARWELSGIMAQQGVSLEERNRMLRLGLEPQAGWETPLVPSSLVPADTFGNGDGL